MFLHRDFDAFLFELFFEFSGLFLQRAAFGCDALLFVHALHAGFVASFTPLQECFPGEARVFDWVGGDGEHQAHHINAQNQENRGWAECFVNRIFADPEAKKSAWPFDPQAFFPTLEENGLNLKKASSQKHHQYTPPHLVAQFVVDEEPLCQSVAQYDNGKEVRSSADEE